MDVGTTVANIDHVVCRNAKLFFELLQPRDFSITGRGPHQAFDLTRSFVPELGAKDMVLRHDPLQRILNRLQRRRREHIKIKVESVNPLVEYLVNLLDIVLEANALPHLEQVVAPDARTELRIMQEKISQLGALLNQVQLCHALDSALEFLDRNAQQLAQDITRIVEGQRLIEVAGKQIMLPMFNSHVPV